MVGSNTANTADGAFNLVGFPLVGYNFPCEGVELFISKVPPVHVLYNPAQTGPLLDPTRNRAPPVHIYASATDRSIKS